VQGRNLHASAVLLGDRGVLITGDSGSGKTTLALALLDHFRRAGRFSRFVSDDQVLLAAENQRLVCQAPDAIGGLVEVYGVGPQPLEFESRMVADLLVRLVPAAEAQRFPEEQTESLNNCKLPCIMLAARNAPAAVFAVASRLSVPPFRQESAHRG
jgi:serine kinase of HPr protein (carbohydrate metabolism regulator)